MKAKFLSTVKKYNMFKNGDRVVVGLSGGADSVCLTSLLLECRNELGIAVEAAHVNHCIRGAEADSDEAFVTRFCLDNNIKLHCKRINVPELAKQTGESIELCARKVRYQFFDEIDADIIATAHTGSDRIETMFINLSRGASLNGLCSIPPVRANIVRPLIDFTRDEIEKYCSQKGISFVIDSTNISDEYTRNKFRHNVVASLKNINPSFEKNALRCIDVINTENSFLCDFSNSILKTALDIDDSLKVSVLCSSDIRIIPRVISSYLNRVCDSDYEMRHIDFIVNHLNESFAITLPGGVIIAGDSCRIGIRKNEEKTDVLFSAVQIDAESEFVYSVFGKQISICVSDSIENISDSIYIADAQKIQGKMLLRTRSSGDTFHLGRRKCSKPINKLFNESKIPSEVRDKILIVADEQGVIFIENFGVDSLREINNETKKYLIIRIKDDKNE